MNQYKNTWLFAQFYIQFTFPDIPTEIVIKVQEGKQGDDSGRQLGYNVT